MQHSQPSYRREEKKQAGSGEFECDLMREKSARGADEIPFAPGERFVDGCEMSMGNFPDEFGLREPLVVSAALEMNHGGESVQLIREPAGEGIF